MVSEDNMVVTDLKRMREELYNLLRSEVGPEQQQDIVVQQGMALSKVAGEGNRQLQVVNVTYNRNVHLKVIDLLKTLDNALDNARDYPQHTIESHSSLTPVGMLEALLVSWANDKLSMREVIRQVARAYYREVNGRAGGIKAVAAKMLQINHQTVAHFAKGEGVESINLWLKEPSDPYKAKRAVSKIEEEKLERKYLGG